MSKQESGGVNGLGAKHEDITAEREATMSPSHEDNESLHNSPP